jgi:hypothetical protein
MARYALYDCIVNAVKTARLKEPFTAKDVRQACPGFAENTYGTFLLRAHFIT